MDDIGLAFPHSIDLILGGDPELLGIVGLSVRVSLSAAVLAFLVGAPIGAVLATTRFRGRTAILVAANALLGLPPVVVGLLVYLLVSRSGPLGPLGLLFTPAAMIVAQTLLATPIAVALTHRLVEGLWSDHGDQLLADGASRLQAMRTLFAIGRAGLITAFLAAFGRAIAEVGAILVVGGNIRGHTRTMTTAIALETSRGDLPLALGLGLVLLTLSVAVSAVGLVLDRWAALRA